MKIDKSTGMEWVRPILSLIVVTGITVGFFVGKITGGEFLGITTFIVTFWFKSRDEDKAKANSQPKDNPDTTAG